MADSQNPGARERAARAVTRQISKQVALTLSEAEVKQIDSFTQGLNDAKAALNRATSDIAARFTTKS